MSKCARGSQQARAIRSICQKRRLPAAGVDVVPLRWLPGCGIDWFIHRHHHYHLGTGHNATATPAMGAADVTKCLIYHAFDSCFDAIRQRAPHGPGRTVSNSARWCFSGWPTCLTLHPCPCCTADRADNRRHGPLELSL